MLNSFFLSLLFQGLCTQCPASHEQPRIYMTHETTDGAPHYIELYCTPDSLYGYYYGFRRSKPEALYYKARIKQNKSHRGPLDFEIYDPVYSHDPITPGAQKINPVKVSSEHLQALSYFGKCEDGKLLLNRIPQFGGSATHRMIFYEIKDSIK